MNVARMLIRGKALFETRNLRERMLFTAILLVATIWALSSVMNAAANQSNELKLLNVDLENQQPWLDEEVNIDARMQAVLSRMDASKTYSSNQMLSIIDEIAREVGLKTTIARPSTRQGEVFTEHVMLIPLSRVEMATLIDFENKVKTHHPYLGMDYLLIEPMPRSPELMRGELRVTAFELNPS
jgi:hypothetical protein